MLSLLLSSFLFAQSADSGMRGITAMEATAEMAPGLNLFNTLDAVCWWCSEPKGMESETIWGNPYTTPEMVQAMADRGFNTLRIPVTWYNHMGPSPDYTIETEWMDRVEEVANYALDANMYVIINIHHDDYNEEHDGSWLCPTYDKQEAVTDQLEKVWTQIALRFRDYSDYLIFETMNEPREVGSPEEWTGGSAEHRNVINAFNLAAVNAIRATGGNNESRFIMIPQVGANGIAALEDLVIPKDDTNIIVSLHSYTPYDFTLNENGQARWGTSEEIKYLQDEIKSYSDHFVKNGIPVVLGEWGAGNKENYGDRILYYDIYTNACKEGGITPVTWIYEFNRNTLTWEYPLIEDAILYAYDSTVVDVEEIVLNVTSDTLYYGDSLQLSATIIPETATSQAIAWTSHNERRASVNSSGLVTAKAPGSVKIRATTIGKTTDCNLYVLDTLIHTEFFIQAEDYYHQSGVQKENCSDENGGQCIGYIENGDRCTYLLRIDSAGIYDFTARVATATEGGTIEIKGNFNVLGTLSVDGSMSNGWQDWYTTESVELGFEKSGYMLDLIFKGGSGSLYNLNWFKIDYNRPFENTPVENKLDYMTDYQLSQNYPNPFNPSTSISFKLPSRVFVSLKVFDLRGKEVATIVNEVLSAGSHTRQWNAVNLSSGVYIYRMQADSFTETKKLVLLR